MYSRHSIIAACCVAALSLASSGALAAQSPNLPPNKSGFPHTVTGGGAVNFSQPVVADLGLSPGGVKSIVFGTKTGFLHVIYWNGSSWGEAPGFPVNVGAYIAASPAVGDINNDGVNEIVVGYGDPASGGPGGVKAYQNNGTLLWTRLSQDRLNGGDGQPDPVIGSPAIGDIDGDGHNEVVWGSTDFQIYAVDGATGADKTGWPKTWDVIRDTVRDTPALYDLDGDGHLWVIIGVDAHQEGAPFNTPNGGCLHVFKYDGTERTGFPKCVDQVISSSPSVGDIDGDGHPEIVHGTGTFYATATPAIYAWHCDGSAVSGWPVSIQGQSSTSPALASLEGGALDVIVTADNTMGSSAFHTYAFRGDGSMIFQAVPKDFFGANLSAGDPVVADVLGNTSAPKILVADNTSVVVFDAAGNQLTDNGSHPGGTVYDFYTAGSLSGVAVANFNDGAGVGVVAVSLAANGTDTTVNVWQPVTRTTPPVWGLFHHDIARTGADPGAGACESACAAPPATALHFFTLTPCRVVDTRNATGPFGGPALSNGDLRDFTMTGACGIPSGATAVSINVTVVSPTALGFVRFSPGCLPPVVSTINFSAGQTRANNAVLSLSATGVLTANAMLAGGGTVQLVVDVNGYFQ
jgi:hypothetical protein